MKTIVVLVGVLIFSSSAISQYYNLSNDVGQSTEPQVVADNKGNVHFVWLDNTSGKNEIYYAVYAAEATGGSTLKRVGSISSTVNECDHPRMTLDTLGDIVHVVYEADSSGKRIILWTSFPYPALVNTYESRQALLCVGIDSSCYRPDIAVVHGISFVCWISDNSNGPSPFKGKLYFTKLDTATGNWTTPIVLADSVATDDGYGNFWGRVTSAFNGTVFYEKRDGMHAVKNLLGSSPSDVVSGGTYSSGWLPYMQRMEVASHGSADSEHVYVLYHGDGTTCNCDEPLVYYMFDGSNWAGPSFIAGSPSESISWGGFDLAVVSDSDIAVIYEKQQWNGQAVVDTLQTAKFNGTQWENSKLLPNVAGFSEPSIAKGTAGNLWMVFSGSSDSGSTDIFAYGSPLTSVHEILRSVSPTGFYVSQNYPNPFNPSTAISYQLSANSFVTLKVYDVLGREVAMLVNGKQSAGYHEVTFDAAKLSSGVYFYRISVGKFSSVKKLVVIK